MVRTREVTCKILEAIDEGSLDPNAVVQMCLSYMSEADVADMAQINDLFPDLEEEEEEATPRATHESVIGC